MASGPQQADGESLSEVNVIPLADLSLVLLIILMVLSPMVVQSMIKVQASRATAMKSSTVQKPEPPLILSVNGDGSVTLNSVKIKDNMDLAAHLAAGLGNRIDKTVLLTVDDAASHGRFVEVLDITKQQGAEKIALLHKAVKK